MSEVLSSDTGEVLIEPEGLGGLLEEPARSTRSFAMQRSGSWTT
jgi:hypothetical protein